MTGTAKAQNTDFAGGDGTESNPYQITNWTHLHNIRDHPDSHFILMNDLNETTGGYDEFVARPPGTGWRPILNFSGTFNGQCHVIERLDTSYKKHPAVGLFGSTENGAEIRNLGLEDFRIRVEGSKAKTVGALVGQVKGAATIENCYSTGHWNPDKIGIRGGKLATGGLIGEIQDTDALIRNCYSHSDVSSGGSAGGLVGINYGEIFRTYAIGKVKPGNAANDYAGGLVGINYGDVSDSFSDKNTSTQDDPIGSNTGTVSNVHSLSTSEMQSLSTYQANSYLDESWDITAVGSGEVNRNYTWNILDQEWYPLLTCKGEELIGETYNLTVNVEPPEGGSVYVEWNNQSTTIEDSDTLTFENNTLVTLSAINNGSWNFSEWKGDVNSQNDSIDVLMDENKTITANFTTAEVVERNLTINVEPPEGGSVYVEWNNQSTTIEDSDTLTFENNTLVTLSAINNEGWGFNNWSGDVVSDVDSIDVLMDENKTITANFAEVIEETYELTYNISGDGSIYINEEEYSENDSMEFGVGEEITLRAEADSGWEFFEWTGDYPSGENEINITMTEDVQVTANFVESDNTFNLSVSANPSDAGSVIVWWDNVTEVVEGQENFTLLGGTEVSLTPDPAENWAFENWSEAATNDTVPLTLTMDGNKEVVANFVESPEEAHSFVLYVFGEGEITVQWNEEDRAFAGEGAYLIEGIPHNSSVTLTAFAASGWEFVDWTGDYTSSDIEIQVKMDDDKTLTSTFKASEEKKVIGGYTLSTSFLSVWAPYIGYLSIISLIAVVIGYSGRHWLKDS